MNNSKLYLTTLFLFLALSLPLSAQTTDKRYFYQIEAGDTLGMVVYSLGHEYLWTGSAYVNKFKNSVNTKNANELDIGDKVYLRDSDIVFRKNIILKNDQIFFKIKSLKKSMGLII